MALPAWLHKYRGTLTHGRWVEHWKVFMGPYMHWVPVTADEACAIVGWCGVESVVYTETKRETFFAEPGAAVRDARVAARIAKEEEAVKAGTLSL